MSLYKMTLHELRDKMKSKEVSSYEVTKSYLDRIEKLDEKVGSYITVCSDKALSKAREVDQKRLDGQDLSDLAGIPVGIKDNICTRNIKTTCASKMLHNFIPPYNATVMNKLEAEDIVMLGKLNMDEFAMGSSTENSYFKKTKNPYDLERVPGGSSGGSAAAVASDQAVFTLGSDTGGSIRQPASFCGVVGMKPTYGAVSRSGLIAFASSLDQIGPITKDVEDMAIILNKIVGHDPMDSTSVPVEYKDFTKSLTKDIKGLKVAMPSEFFKEGINKEVRDAIYKAAKDLEKMGAIVEEVSMNILDYSLPTYYLISSAEASSNLSRFDGVKYGYRAKKFDDLLDLYKKTRDEGFGKEVKRRIMLGTYALSSGYYDAYYKKAMEARTLIQQDFGRVFSKYDVILSPVAPTTAYKIGEKTTDPVEMYMGDICTVPVNIAGVPALSINCGFDSNKMPIGMQLIANSFKEDILIKTAYAYEQEVGKILGGEKHV